jgi:hypothetical protein
LINHKKGGRLGDNLVELGAIDRRKFEGFLQRLPQEPASIADTDIAEADPFSLPLKLIYTGRIETIDQFVEAIKLPHHLATVLTRTFLPAAC